MKIIQQGWIFVISVYKGVNQKKISQLLLTPFKILLHKLFKILIVVTIINIYYSNITAICVEIITFALI